MAEIKRPKDAQEMRALVEGSYERLREAMSRIPEGRWDEPALPGGWSLKEDLDHVALWEGALLHHVDPAVELDGPVDLPWGDTDAVNEKFREWTRSQSVASVKERADRTHAGMRALLLTIDDARMDETVTGGNKQWWRAVADETWDHYPEHFQMLEAAFPD